ncbi:DUF1284 domain-containing protein [Methanobrevibacter sp. DSM 116169]|uniref:DUF1284 domain-containing protein n=1 Tax=Methanobrevibacter sp. DSM 116169 TaxID=3242727 RepID=UPI0038FC385D
MIISLRGHHLLCLQGFQGYGYDESFVENMKEIKNLINNKNTKIKILNTSDDICKYCPNLTDTGLCIDEKSNLKIQSMDNEVINKLNLDVDEIISEDLFNIINNIFKSSEDIDPICNNCLWTKECLWANSIYNK